MLTFLSRRAVRIADREGYHYQSFGLQPNYRAMSGAWKTNGKRYYQSFGLQPNYRACPYSTQAILWGLPSVLRDRL